jgi:ketol-acid reductoisomerase
MEAGVELALKPYDANRYNEESAYYESLHDCLWLLIPARKKLYEMNRIISDTEYGCYLFDHACKPH